MPAQHPDRSQQRRAVMKVLSPEEDNTSYATLNGHNQTVDIKIASNPGSVMSVKRNSDIREHHQTYTYDEPSEVQEL